jgi:tripartite-type tricarboxylate transporter receptor subunit TctC
MMPAKRPMARTVLSACSELQVAKPGLRRLWRGLFGWLNACALMLWASAAIAQAFPTRPLRIIVPLAPGGVIDVYARAIGAVVHESTGQPVIVEDRPGASSIIGMTACAKAPPDGYTICLTNADSLSYGPHVFASLPYDAETDFTPITNLGWTNNIIVAHAGVPFDTYKGMIAYAKANPGVLNWATWGSATLPDLYLRWIKHQTGVDIVAIPYNGAAQGNPSIYSGQTQATYMGVGTALPQMQAGKIKPIVAVGSRRLSYLPDLPTLGEEGGDPDLPSYFGMFGPAGLPAPIVERWNKELTAALRDPNVLALMRSFTVDAVGNSPTEFAAFMKADRDNAGKVFRMLGILPQKAP